MKNLILTLIITLPLTLLGQGWEQTYGGPNNQIGKSIQQTTDGSYIITGTKYSIINGSNDVYLLKIDENGNVQWSRTFGGNEYDSGNSIQQTTDGGYIIYGTTNSFGNGQSDVYLIKTDENGNEIWSQTFGGNEYDSGNSVQQTTDGGFIIIGTFEVEYNYTDIYLIKTDENGNEQWTQTYGGESFDSGNSVQQTSDGGYIITGGTESFGNGEEEVYLIKTDENGNELWSNTFGGTWFDIGHSVQQTTDGGYILLGSGYNGQNNICLVKTDENGNEQWSQTYGGGGKDICYSFQQTTDGGCIMVGFTDSFGNGTSDVYLIKTDENGNEIWSQTFGDIYVEKGFSIDITTDEGYIITGSKEFNVNGNPFTDVYVIKTNQFGNITSTTEIQLPNPDKKLEKTVNLIGQEIKPQTNSPIIEIFDDGSTQKKIIIE